MFICLEEVTSTPAEDSKGMMTTVRRLVRLKEIKDVRDGGFLHRRVKIESRDGTVESIRVLDSFDSIISKINWNVTREGTIKDD